MTNPTNDERAAYEPPAIIYEGEITVRAGSHYPGPKADYDVDPATLFGGR